MKAQVGNRSDSITRRLQQKLLQRKGVLAITTFHGLVKSSTIV